MTRAGPLPGAALAAGKTLTIANVPDGFQGVAIADLARSIGARAKAGGAGILVVCRDIERLSALQRALAFFAPEIETLPFPAWRIRHDVRQPLDRRWTSRTAIAGRPTSAHFALVSTVLRNDDGIGVRSRHCRASVLALDSGSSVRDELFARAGIHARGCDEHP